MSVDQWRLFAEKGFYRPTPAEERQKLSDLISGVTVNGDPNILETAQSALRFLTEQGRIRTNNALWLEYLKVLAQLRTADPSPDFERWFNPRVDVVLNGLPVAGEFLADGPSFMRWLQIVSWHCPSVGIQEVNLSTDGAVAYGFQGYQRIDGFCIQVGPNGVINRVETVLL